MNTLLLFLKFIPLLRFSYTDFREQRIDNAELIVSFIWALLIFHLEYSFFELDLLFRKFLISIVFYFLLLCSVCFLEAIFNSFLFGGGDLKVITYILFCYERKTLLETLFVTHVLIAMYYWSIKRFPSINILTSNHVKNRKHFLIIYIPFLSLGCLIVLVLQHFHR